MTKTAIAYLRVSTGRQDISPRAQLQKIESWCASNGVELVGTHTEDVSGGAQLEKRPHLLDAIEATKDADLLLVSKRCRLSRDVITSAMIHRLVERNGAEVLSVCGLGNGTSPEEEMFRNIIATFAQYERRLIGVRTRRALAQLKREGVRLGRSGLGIRHLEEEDEHGRRVIEAVPIELQAVERILELRAAGATFAVIAATMNEEGWPTKRGGQWGVSTVYRICKRHQAEAA